MNAKIKAMMQGRWFPAGPRAGLARLFRLLPLCAILLVAMSPKLSAQEAEAPGTRLLKPAELHARLGCAGGSNTVARSSSAAAVTGAHLNYYGGRVLSNVKIIMVLYGSGTYGSFITNDAAPSMVSFYQQVVNSSYLDWLCEYNTPTQTIGRGTYGGKYAITPSASNNHSTIGDSNIQAELARQIQLGLLPAPDANTLYMVHFPKGKSITIGRTRSCVSGGFCAYHSTGLMGSTEIYYAVMPDMSPGSGCNTGCGGGATVFDNQCSAASHELIESITDAEVGIGTTIGYPLAWYDPANGEIGDICNAIEVMFAGTDGNIYTVQAGFSNSANDCIASRTILPPVANNQNVTSRQGTPIAIALSGLDVNVCPRAITFNVSASPSHGVLSGTAPSLTYTPDPTYFGPDSFQFIVNNGLLNSSPATVGITLVSASISLAQLPDRNVQIAFAATPSTSFEVQATDLLTNPSPWVTLLITNSGTNTMLRVDDLDATNHQRRYYRTATP